MSSSHSAVEKAVNHINKMDARNEVRRIKPFSSCSQHLKSGEIQNMRTDLYWSDIHMTVEIGTD